MPEYKLRIETTARAWSGALSDRISRTTPRERILLGGLILAALVIAPFVALDWRTQQADRVLEAMTERSAATLSRSAAQRVAASASNDAAVEDMKSWGFDGANVAILQVRIEQALVSAARAVGLPNPQITVSDEVEVIGPTRWLSAEVQADLLWRPTFAFLDNLTAWPEGFRVTSFRYETTPAPSAGMLLNGQPTTASGGRVTIGLAFPLSADAVAVVP